MTEYERCENDAGKNRYLEMIGDLASRLIDFIEEDAKAGKIEAVNNEHEVMIQIRKIVTSASFTDWVLEMVNRKLTLVCPEPGE